MIKKIVNWMIDRAGIYSNQKRAYALSTFAVAITGKKWKTNKKLRELKNKYAGQRCFIIGNGPSLTAEDLDRLKGEVTFASNRIYNIFDKTDWRPTFYGAFDESLGYDDNAHPNINAFECEGKFFRAQGWYTFRTMKNSYFIYTWHDRKYLDQPAFSTDLTKGIYTIATVTYALMQLARYMGFSEIYLLGVDHKYAYELKKDGSTVHNEGIVSYFANEKHPTANGASASWEMDIAYEYAERYSRENGFRIYNATRGGYLEAFERTDFDSLFVDCQRKDV